MPGLRARPGIGARVSLSEFRRLVFGLRRCGSVSYNHHGSHAASLVRESRATDGALRRPVVGDFGDFRVWRSRILWTLAPGSGSCRGVASVRSQAQENAPAAAKRYKTLAELCRSTLDVKKSKFIAVATPVDDEAAALAFLSQVRDTSASHNCWAFKIGDRTRFSDDGEPGGTAGRPMLAAITSSGIDHVMVVVARFFGGTKLGTGGLVRAYGTVTTDCLKGAETVEVKAKVSLKIRAPYDVLGVLYPLLQKYDVQKLDEIFDTEGEGGVTMDLMVDVENLPHLKRDLELTTNGRASVSDVHQCS